MIELAGVRYAYPGAALPAIDGVTLTLREGEAAVIVGPNGSGKSTMARLLNGLLIPQEGAVRVDGFLTAEGGLYDARVRVGLVFQNPDNQIVASVVERDCAFALENLGVPRDEMRERVAWALAATGLSAETGRLAHTLSGGQKQRLAIAGVLAMRPRYLVLDEPYAMLDPMGRTEVAAVVESLHIEGIGIVLVTQEMEATLAADRLIAIDRGKIAYDGPVEAFFRDGPLVRRLGLEIPLPFRMLESLRALHGIEPARPSLEEAKRLLIGKLVS